MKRMISVITILMTIIALFSTVYCQGVGDTADYYGMLTYIALYNNIDFTDIDGHWARDSIYKMASLSIIRGMGNNRFNPDSILTREQALILLVRLMGLESEAQSSGEENISHLDTGGYTILTSYDYWIQGYIDTAVSNNIITDDEVDEITKLSEDEEYNLETEVEMSLLRYEDDLRLTEEQLNNIKEQLRQKTELRYTWQKPIKRERVAVWAARIMGLTPVTGQAQQKIYTLKDWRDISTENLSMIEAVLQRGIMQGDGNGYFRPSSSLKRGEMTKIIDNIHKEIFQGRGFTITEGIIQSIEDIKEYVDNKEIIKTIFSIKNYDNSISTVLTRKSEEGNENTDFIVNKNGRIYFSEELNEYDYIRYYVSPEGYLVYAEVLDNKLSVIEGTIEEIDLNNKYLSIQDYNGNKFNLKTSEEVEIAVNDQKAELDDLLKGQDVTLKISNGEIVSIDGYLNIEKEGYIHPGERIALGKVLYIDKANNKITILEKGIQNDYIAENIPVLKDGRNVGLDGIREGDIVRLEFDRYYGNKPVNIYISAPERQYLNIIRASISDFNPTRDEIIINDAFYYRHGGWSDKSELTRINLGNGIEIYKDGISIGKNELRSYKGKDVYIITEDNFGREEAFKIVFKEGYEKKYNNKIQDILFGDGKIKVDYNEMYFDYNSTIIVKDNRLIHPYNLNINDQVQVITYGRDKDTAVFISVENFLDNGVLVYRGEIDEIDEYSFKMYGYDRLVNTDWTTSSAVATFNISEDTRIIDTSEDEVREIEVEDFINSRFLKGKDRDNNYYGDYAYAVEYDDMTICINIVDETEIPQVISMGTVKNTDFGNGIITLDEVRDYSDFEKKWNINETEVDINVNKAVIIKNGKLVGIEDILPMDNLYVLRTNDTGYMVIVK